MLANDAATLVYLAGQNAITPHVWTSRGRPARAARPADLRPRPVRTPAFADVRAAARTLGDLLRELGLAPFAMTTGSRGLHVVTPLKRTADYGPVRELAADVAQRMVDERPAAPDVEFRKAERGGRIFFDTGRTAYGQHAVAPYAVRARPGAPVAMPLHWAELEDRGLASDRWTIATVPDRLADAGDPWSELAGAAAAPGQAAKALARLNSR